MIARPSTAERSLFDQQVLVGPHAFAQHVDVRVVRRGEDHRVDAGLLQHLVGMGVDARLGHAELGGPCALLLIGVRRRHELRPIENRQILEMLAAHHAEPDDSVAHRHQPLVSVVSGVTGVCGGKRP